MNFLQKFEAPTLDQPHGARFAARVVIPCTMGIQFPQNMQLYVWQLTQFGVVAQWFLEHHLKTRSNIKTIVVI